MKYESRTLFANQYFMVHVMSGFNLAIAHRFFGKKVYRLKPVVVFLVWARCAPELLVACFCLYQWFHSISFNTLNLNVFLILFCIYIFFQDICMSFIILYLQMNFRPFWYINEIHIVETMKLLFLDSNSSDSIPGASWTLLQGSFNFEVLGRSLTHSEMQA